jgi:ELWxxDGT repeat protein
MKKIATSLLALAIAGSAMAQKPTLLKDIFPGKDNGLYFLKGSTVYNGKLYFAAQNAMGNYEVWSTDGTEAGTTMLTDIDGAAGSNPYNFTVFNNSLFFSAKTAAEGNELYKTDGTAAGTAMVKELMAGTASAYPRNFTEFKGSLYFTADLDGAGGFHHVIFKTDGTATNTAPLSLGPWTMGSMYYAKLNNKMYFGCDNTLATTGIELWETDGTQAGTTLIKDINPGTSSGQPEFLTVFGNKFIFSANEQATGYELYISDGTTAGTTLVKDINPGTGSSSPHGFTELNGKMYFFAEDGTTGRELWVTDGTDAGTTMVKNIDNSAQNSISFTPLVKMGSKLYFAANDGTHGIELWVTDGTAAGTTMLVDINAGQKDALLWLSDKSVINDKLYFVGNDGTHGNEPWVTDGTVAGTKMIYDVYPGADSSMLNSEYEFVAMNNKIFFPADDGVTGSEIRYINLPVGISEKAMDKAVSVSPNPSTGIISVSAPTKVNVAICNTYGQQVYSAEINGKEQVNLSNQPKGMYYINIAEEGKQAKTEKLVLY